MPLKLFQKGITLAEVLAKISCSSIIFCTSPWKSLQVGHAEITNAAFVRLYWIEAQPIQELADNQYTLREVLLGKKLNKKHHNIFYHIRTSILTAIKIWTLRNKSLRHDK